jgi:hypothetical protein
MLKRLLMLLLLAAAAPANADDQTLRFYGYAYDLKTGKYLYTEVHEQHARGDQWLGGTMTYFDPDGKQIGRKTLDFSKDTHIPLYRLVLSGSGYEEGISAIGNKVEMFKRHAKGEEEERASLGKTAEMAADSGFHTYIREHFAEIMAGKTVSFSLIVAGNLDSYKFRIKRAGDTQFEGQPAVNLRVEPDSLLRFLVDPLELIYEPKQRKLVEYRGISNIHDASGKPYTARVDYYSKPPADAPKSLPPLQ